MPPGGEAAFAVVVSWFDWFDAKGRAGALLAVTIAGGFASSIFLPLTGVLVDRYGWRTAVQVLAVVYGATAISLYLIVVRRRGRTVQEPAASDECVAVAGAVVRRRPFWLLVAAFTANGGAVSVMAVVLVSYLIHLGHPPVLAATVAGLLGVLSVTGRLVTTGLQRRVSAVLVAAVIFALQAVAALLLPVGGHSTAGAVGCVLLFGLGFGVASITLPHLLTGRYGTIAYATLSGRIAVFSVADKALAPLGAVALAQTAGYSWVMALVATASAIATLALLAYHRL